MGEMGKGGSPILLKGHNRHGFEKREGMGAKAAAIFDGERDQDMGTTMNRGDGLGICLI